MAKLKATPHTYAEAAEYLAGRESVKLGNNTWLERIKSDYTRTGAFVDSPVIGVRLHLTYIVRFYESGEVTLHTGGWHSVTTKSRINQFIKGAVYQKDWQWYYVPPSREPLVRDWAHPVIFNEGMNVA